LTVGTVLGTNGITTNTNAVSLTTVVGDVVVAQPINAGLANTAASNVTITANGSILGTLANANDGLPEITGNVITLTSTAVTNGNTGRIGFFSGIAQFFEVDANVLNASDNDSRMWISEVGTAARAGTAVG